MNRSLQIVIFVLLSAAAWLAWQKPAPVPDRSTIRVKAPQAVESPSTLWRVVTRSVVSLPAANTLEFRLRQLGLTPIRLEQQEDVTLHAFDDAQVFSDRNEAIAALKTWRDCKVDNTLIQVDSAHWLIGLGRYYQPEHAEGERQQLEACSRPFRYQQRLLSIPTWRFTFSPTPKQEAETIWQMLKTQGLLTPSMINEANFQSPYKGAKTKEPKSTPDEMPDETPEGTN